MLCSSGNKCSFSSISNTSHLNVVLFFSFISITLTTCSFVNTDTSRVSFEAADRPNYFLSASPSGQVSLAKWEESEAFWDRATFVLHRNTRVPGYDSLESHAKPGFFLYAALPRLHLLKYRHVDSFRKATLFRLTGRTESPICLLTLLQRWQRFDYVCVVPQAPDQMLHQLPSASGGTTPVSGPASRPAVTHRLPPAPPSHSESDTHNKPWLL